MPRQKGKVSLKIRSRELSLPDYQMAIFMIVHTVDGVNDASIQMNLSEFDDQQVSAMTAEMVSAYLQSQAAKSWDR